MATNPTQEIDNDIPVFSDEERQELFDRKTVTIKDQIEGIPLFSAEEFEFLKIDKITPVQEEVNQLQRLQDMSVIREQVMEEQQELESMGTAVLDTFFGAGELIVQGVTGTVGLLEGVLGGAAASAFNTLDPVPTTSPGNGELSNTDLFTLSLQDAQEKNEFQPSTDFAKGVNNALNTYIVEPINRFAEKGGQATYDLSGSSALAALEEGVVKTAPAVLSFYVPIPKIFNKKGKSEPDTAEPEVQPQSLSEKEIRDQVDAEKALEEADPIKENDTAIMEELEQTMLRKIELEERLDIAVSDSDKANQAAALVFLEEQASALAAQLSKNKADEISSFVGRDLRLDPLGDEPEFYITGPDNKTYIDLKKEIFTIKPKLHSDGSVEPVFIKRVKDISWNQANIGGMIKPGKFMSELNPVVHNGVSKVTAHMVRARNLTEQILNRPKFTEAFGVTALRKAKLSGTDAGALTIYNSLPIDRRNAIREAGLEFDKDRIEPTVSDLESRDLSSKEITSYNALRAGLKIAVAHVNKSIARYGKEGDSIIESIPGYLPHIWFSDFRVFVRDGGGNYINALPAKTRIGAGRLAKKYLKTNPTHTAKVENATKRERGQDEAVMLFSEAASFMERRGAGEVAKDVRKFFEDNILVAGFSSHQKERSDIGGFAGSEVRGVKKSPTRLVDEFTRGYTAYIEGAMRFAENLRMKKEMNKIYLDPAISMGYPNSLNYVKLYQDNAMGTRGITSQFLEKATESWMGRNGLRSAFQGLNSATAIAKLFVFNPKFLFLQGIQPFQMISSALLNSKAFGMKGSALKSIGEGLNSFFRPDAESVEAVKFAIKKGTIEPKLINETIGDNFFDRGVFTKGQKVFEVMSGRSVAAKMEVWSRTMETLIIHKHLRNSGVPQPEAISKAAYLTDKHMTEYNARERPILFGEKGPLGQAGKNVGIFKTYTFNWLNQLASFYKTAKNKKDLKPLAAYLGSQAFVGGIIGFIGVKEADIILDLMGMTTVSEWALGSGNSDITAYGPVSAGLDLDLTSSTQAPGILPRDLLSLPGIDYASGIAASSWNLSKKIMSGLVTEIDAMQFYKALAPTSMHGFIEKAYTKDGDSPVPDPNKRGRGKLRRDFYDWRARFLSTRTLSERRTLDSLWQLTRMKKKQALSRDNIITYAAYLVNNDYDLPDWLIDKAFAEENAPFTNGRSFMSAIILRTKQMNNSVIDRLTQYGRTKKGREAIQKLESYGVSTYD